MYGGVECDESAEDLELERYGLTEGQNSGSGESDTEEALYRQVHYNIINDRNIQSTKDGDAQSARSDECPPTTKTASSLRTLGNSDSYEVTVISNGILIASDDDDGCYRKREESDSKYRVCQGNKLKLEDVQSSRKTKTAVVIRDDSESDIVLLDVKSKPKGFKSEGKVDQEKKRPKKRSWKTNSDDEKTKTARLDRSSWSSAVPVADSSSSDARASEVVVVADDSSSSSVILLDSEKSEGDVTQTKQLPKKGGGEYFLDSKGMALEDVSREKDSAEEGWKAERLKTKAMLKEGIDVINLSSEEEDCMVIGSCSEEEGLHVHFDEMGDQIPPDAEGSLISKRKARKKERVVPGRYFVQSMVKHIRCYNCNEMGHNKSECPQPPHIPACILCGTRGHTDRSCPHALCFNCSLPGHQSKACPVKRHIRYAWCTRCQMQGHLRKTCPDQWRQYLLTTEHGPIIKPTRIHHPLKQKAVYCSNCSQKGHRYYDCHSERFDEFVTFTYDKVCVYDRKHIAKMIYPEEHKNAEYLQLLKGRKGDASLSITKTKGKRSITEVVSSSVTKEATTSSTQEANLLNTKKGKFTQEDEQEEETTQSDDIEVVSIEKAQTSKKEMLNPVKTFVRTRLFGGRRGRGWAEQEVEMIPSKEKMDAVTAPDGLFGGRKGCDLAEQEIHVDMITSKEKMDAVTAPEGLFGGRKGHDWAEQEMDRISSKEKMDAVSAPKGGKIKLTRAQKKEQQKALKAMRKGANNPEDAARDFTEAKQLKHSAVKAMNVLKREIKAKLKATKGQVASLGEVTDSMSKFEKKAMKKKLKKKEKQEVQLVLNERIKSDVKVREMNRVCKESKKLFRDAKKWKQEVDGRARRALGIPKKRKRPVLRKDAVGYSVPQRGFNIDARLVEGTHQDNLWTKPQGDLWEQDFPRNNTPYDFTNRLFTTGPVTIDPFYSNSSVSHSRTAAFNHDQTNYAAFDSGQDFTGLLFSNRPVTSNPSYGNGPGFHGQTYNNNAAFDHDQDFAEGLQSGNQSLTIEVSCGKKKKNRRRKRNRKNKQGGQMG
nr:uncharacterized protein LOC129281877 isoform X1 [Lytechinus pictus]